VFASSEPNHIVIRPLLIQGYPVSSARDRVSNSKP